MKNRIVNCLPGLGILDLILGLGWVDGGIEYSCLITFLAGITVMGLGVLTLKIADIVCDPEQKNRRVRVIRHN